MIADTLRRRDILRVMCVPCQVDLWGRDVNHDRPWWRKQLPSFLAKLLR